jgi:hydroxymethylpyrimidine/phosphomethylpyrimidine kinase
VIPSALTIAGLDPSGGAGIAADLRAFAAAGVWGAAACAALTVQSTRGVRSVRAVGAALVVEQAREVLRDMSIFAVKTGALGSAANVRALARLARELPDLPFVVDPVMSPTRGARESLSGPGVRLAMLALARTAALVTPNRAEASALAGRAVRTEAEARACAERLVESGCRAVLVKGGHGGGAKSVDYLATRSGLAKIELPRRRLSPIHGTGCTLAALVAGHLARRGGGPPSDRDLLASVEWARARLDRALEGPLEVGGGLLVLRLDAAARPRARSGGKGPFAARVRR